jgi:hypothetical protein
VESEGSVWKKSCGPANPQQRLVFVSDAGVGLQLPARVLLGFKLSLLWHAAFFPLSDGRLLDSKCLRNSRLRTVVS